jgi:hypothetical protein
MTDEALIKIDFVRTFPGKYWISDWSRDESYPEGYRYKILSNFDRDTNFSELVVVIEEPNGDKTEMARMDVKKDALERVGNTLVEGLSEDFGLEFEFQDHSSLETPEEFEQAIFKAGWHEYEA